MPTVEFLIQKQKIHVGKYANLKSAARKHGIELGNGVIEVIEGVENFSPKTLWEKWMLKGEPDNLRLAGSAEVLGDVCVITNFTPKPSRQ